MPKDLLQLSQQELASAGEDRPRQPLVGAAPAPMDQGNVARGTLPRDLLEGSMQQTAPMGQSAALGSPGMPQAMPMGQPSMMPAPAAAQAAPDDLSMWQRVRKYLTGEERQTRATQELPELGQGGLLSTEDPAKVAKVAPAILGTFEPRGIANILTSNFPGTIGIIEDEKGNLIAGNNKTGAQVVLNQPGWSPMDVLQGLGVTVAFTPAAGASRGAQTALGGAARVGAATAATQAGISAGTQAAGAQRSIEDIARDIAIAGAGGAAFEAIFQGLANIVPALREGVRAAGGRITPAARNRARQQAAQQGLDPEMLTDDVIDDLIRAGEEAPTPAQAPALQGEREFGIQLSPAQREGTQSALRREDLMLSQAPDVRTQLEARQRGQAQEALGGIQERLGGQPVRQVQEAVQPIRAGVQEAEEAANAIVRQAYEEVGEAALRPEGFQGLLRASRTALQGPEFDKTLPETAKILKQLRNTEKFLFGGEQVRALPINIERLEQMRRRFDTALGAAGSGTPDHRQLTIIKKAWDNYLDDAVNQALFQGDEQALTALKNARGLHSEYVKRFRTQPKKRRGRTLDPDRPGQLVEKIVDANPTDAEVANAIFGAGRTFGNAASRNMVRRFREVLGTDSEGWQAIRQAGLRKLLQYQPDGKTISGQRTVKAIEDALATNKEALNTLYTPEEIALFRRFAEQVRRTQPFIQKSRSGASGTPQMLMDAARELGLSNLLGAPIRLIPGVGAQFQEVAARQKARQALRPFSGLITARREPVAAGTAAAVAGAQQEEGAR